MRRNKKRGKKNKEWRRNIFESANHTSYRAALLVGLILTFLAVFFLPHH